MHELDIVREILTLVTMFNNRSRKTTCHLIDLLQTLFEEPTQDFEDNFIAEE